MIENLGLSLTLILYEKGNQMRDSGYPFDYVEKIVIDTSMHLKQFDKEYFICILHDFKNSEFFLIGSNDDYAEHKFYVYE